MQFVGFLLQRGDGCHVDSLEFTETWQGGGIKHFNRFTNAKSYFLVLSRKTIPAFVRDSRIPSLVVLSNVLC